LFLFATLYEGFGLPILEASACGTPVVTSNVSSMNEIASELTFRVDPESQEGITEKILDVLLQHGRGSVKRGETTAAAPWPRWREMATRILTLYHEG
jgi:glycosyltransferase involved in cell wall biosynthesis